MTLRVHRNAAIAGARPPCAFIGPCPSLAEAREARQSLADFRENLRLVGNVLRCGRPTPCLARVSGRTGENSMGSLSVSRVLPSNIFRRVGAGRQSTARARRAIGSPHSCTK